ncbi:MAG: VWA domain-containing protein [Planctomycetaceae bacterium]|nr:MAG: VWA domain-containing protein [Planctomycetaceae bacterium]
MSTETVTDSRLGDLQSSPLGPPPRATDVTTSEFETTSPADVSQATDAALADPWDDESPEEDAGWFSDESAAFVVSLIVHLSLLLMLGLTPLLISPDVDSVVLTASESTEPTEEFRILDDLTYSDVPHQEMGANSTVDAGMAEASAEMFAETAEIPNPAEMEPDVRGDVFVNNLFSQPVAPLDRLSDQRGKVGEGVQGAAGAIDRLTFEILQSLEERPTLVVWLFDQSGSLTRQRQEIRDRFDKIYEELGIIVAEREKSLTRAEQREIPLLTSVIGFGQDVQLFTEKPTDDLAEIKAIVDGLPVDTSGIERPFTAVELAVDRYKSYRRASGGQPDRNVMLVVVTDERGDDMNRLEPAIKACRRYGMPVFVIGTPAPFGRDTVLIKYVDPDPNYDQSPQWAEVDAGPESLMPEMVRVGFSGNFQDEPVIDSGFGPYGLTRLAFETGGIFFTVHPNRNVNRDVRRGEIEPFAADIRRFFDPTLMARYRPDYLAPQDYEKRLKSSPLRTSLVAAAMQVAPTLDRPRSRFVKRSEAQLVGELTRAQQDAAKLEPTLIRLAAILEPGMKVRESETTPRWRAGYDLAMGRVLAQKVRTETYNAMLAKAKRGLNFEDAKNNTWVITPDDEISVGSKWEKEAELAKKLLQEVADQHAGTPWAFLASEELKVPLGWKWKEEFTDLAPPAPRGPGNNNNNNTPAPPSDEQRTMLARPPSRPVPKL